MVRPTNILQGRGRDIGSDFISWTLMSGLD